MLRRKKLGIQEDSSESPVIREGFNSRNSKTYGYSQ